MSEFITLRIREYRRLAQDGVLAVGLLISLGFLGLFVVYPLLQILSVSVSSEAAAVYQRLLAARGTWRVILNTLWMGLGVASVGTLLGFLFAFVQVKLDVPFKRFFNLVGILPIISPPFAVAMSTIVLFGRSGLITKRLLGLRYDIYGLDGLVLVMAISFFPVAYLTLLGMMRALDPSLEEAAVNLGASRWRVFRTVTLPMLTPGLASSFLLLFVEALADLANPLLIGGNYTVLASRIYLAIIGEYDLTAGAVLSLILLAPSLTIFFFQHYWVSRRSYVSVTGKPTGRHKPISSPWVKWPLFGLCLLVSGLILLMYGFIFVGAVTKVWGINYGLTLEHFHFVLFGYGSEAMIDTTLLATIATPVAGLMGMLIAFLVVRRQFVGRELVDFTSVLGLAVPGTVVGIGFILAFNQPMWGGLIPKLTGTALVIVLAYVVRCIPGSVRSGVAAMQQVDAAMEEASASLGARSVATFRRITLPLIRPAFLTGLIYSFARSMTSLSAIIFLVTPRWRIMTAQILNEAETGRFGNAAAYCIVLIVIVLAAIGLMYAGVGSTTGAERLVET
ncbi:MAG: iron ABC transporter permease [Chloroflexota bacterium]|nr:iron ABC transporter permease [Chloroflexota bacterium]